MKPRLILGLMSGTSVDAIDAALVQFPASPLNRKSKIENRKSPLPVFQNSAFSIQHFLSTPWPRPLRARLLAAMAPASTTTQELCRLNTLVSHHFARAALRAIQKSGYTPPDITAIASHGQTICHLPPGVDLPSSRPRKHRQSQNKVVFCLNKHENSTPLHGFAQIVRTPTTTATYNRSPSKNPPSTLQLGDPSIIATLTGITTVGNFRPADMALGGQGAPLVPFADAMLLSHSAKTRCIQNIGGIANLTYLPPWDRLSGSTELAEVSRSSAVTAFDTGPGNMLMDALISLSTGGQKTYDRHGRLAASGKLDESLFAQLRQHPFFSRRPPKSTGREDFGNSLAQQILQSCEPLRGLRDLHVCNLLATAAHLTAWSIVDAYLSYLPALPDEVILCGGGADNPFLVHLLQHYLTTATTKSISISRIDDHGIPNKAKEALSFALLGLATLGHLPSNLPSVTGAARPAVLGVIAHP